MHKKNLVISKVGVFLKISTNISLQFACKNLKIAKIGDGSFMQFKKNIYIIFLRKMITDFENRPEHHNRLLRPKLAFFFLNLVELL